MYICIHAYAYINICIWTCAICKCTFFESVRAYFYTLLYSHTRVRTDHAQKLCIHVQISLFSLTRTPGIVEDNKTSHEMLQERKKISAGFRGFPFHHRCHVLDALLRCLCSHFRHHQRPRIDPHFFLLICVHPMLSSPVDVVGTVHLCTYDSTHTPGSINVCENCSLRSQQFNEKMPFQKSF